MLIHLMEAVEHVAKVVRPDGDHRRQTYGRIHRVAAADPIPELEHVRRVDAEFRNLLGVGRDSDEMLGNRF